MLGLFRKQNSHRSQPNIVDYKAKYDSCVNSIEYSLQRLSELNLELRCRILETYIPMYEVPHSTENKELSNEMCEIKALLERSHNFVLNLIKILTEERKSI